MEGFNLINRWHIYGFLKGDSNIKINPKDIEEAPADEIKEGIIEYLMFKNREMEGY